MSEKEKSSICPNCQQVAPIINETIVCETCDAEFKITKKDGARVKKTGRFKSIEKRLDDIEAHFPDEPEPDTPEPEEPKAAADQDDDEDFI